MGILTSRSCGTNPPFRRGTGGIAVVTIAAIRQRYGVHICRRCINEEYGVRLTSQDCVYDCHYPRKCPRCGEMRNIVTGFRFSGRAKLLFLSPLGGKRASE